MRRLVNRIDHLLDLRSLRAEDRKTLPAPSIAGPCTVRAAFDPALRHARRHDRGAQLKRIVSPNGLFPNGTSDRWEFLFHLPSRRGIANIELQILEVEDSGWSPEHTATWSVWVRPFPTREAALYRMMQEGKLLYRQFEGHWRQEMRRSPPLPWSFRDSDEALQDFVVQGLDPTIHEFSFASRLGAGGHPVWAAHGRHEEWETPFVRQG